MSEGESPKPSRRDLLKGFLKPQQNSQSQENLKTEQHESNPTASRRDILKALGILALGLRSDTNKASEKQGIIDYVADYVPPQNYEYPDDDTFRPIEFTNNQLITESNHRLKEGLGSHKSAIVVVHAGYVDSVVDSIPEKLKLYNDPEIDKFWIDIVSGQSGNYKQHLNNLTAVTEDLKATTIPVIFAVEDYAARNPTIPYPKVNPPDNAFVLITENADSNLPKKIEVEEDKKVSQEPELLYAALKEAGVETIIMAGEFSFNSSGNLACLGGVAQQFQEAGFQIQGLAGAVYPTRKPEVEEGKDILSALYDNAVPLNSLPSLLHE